MSARKTEIKTASQPVPDAVNVRFELPYLPANEVFLAGSFNEWHPAMFPMIESDDGTWVKELRLPSGTYEYRFVVDGHWITDPNNPQSKANPFGGLNSVIEVAPPKTDSSSSSARFRKRNFVL